MQNVFRFKKPKLDKTDAEQPAPDAGNGAVKEQKEPLLKVGAFNGFNIPSLHIGGRRVQLFRRDPFGNLIIFKSALISLLGIATYSRFNIINKMKIEGAEHLLDLPKNNVLFISNHQTYFADVIALFHVFCSSKWRFKNINVPLYLFGPKTNTFYVAAEETMKDSGFLPKLFSYAGALTVKRSWRHKGSDVNRNADIKAPAKIKKALDFGWVVTFPQGTTKPQAPARKGTASMIHAFNPIVVPVYIDGFRKAFDKKGLSFRKKGVTLTIRFEAPLKFPPEMTVDEIHNFIEKHVNPYVGPVSEDEE